MLSAVPRQPKIVRDMTWAPARVLALAAFVIGLVLYVDPHFSQAQNAEPRSPAEPRSSSSDEIVVILHPSVTSEDLAYLASVTIPVEYRTKAGESLAAIARKRYGIQGRFRASLQKLNETLSHQLARTGQDLMWARLPQDTEVKLLPVSRIAEDVPITVNSKTSLLNLARQYYPSPGPKTLAAIEETNKGKIRSGNLTRGTRLTLPWVPAVQVIRVKPGTADGVLASLEARRIGKGFPNRFGLLEQPITSHSGLRDIQADEKWFIGGLGARDILPQDLNLKSDVIVSVLDSGIDVQHPAFARDLWTDSSEAETYIEEVVADTHGINAVDFNNDLTDVEPHFHGTHVAGIASGRLLKDWSPAFSGSALDDRLKLMIVKVVREQIKEKDAQPGVAGNATGPQYEKEYKVDVGAVLVGIDFATKKNAKIISGSWNFASLPELKTTIETKSGTLFVFAAGNGRIETVNGEQLQVGFDIDNIPVYPASFKLPNVITVGALDPNGEPAYFSNFGTGSVQLFAPGYKIKSTVASFSTDGPYATESGTSQATPFVALTAGLIWAKDGTLGAGAVRKRILDTADPEPKLLTYSQYGKLDLLKAISIDIDLFQLANGKFLRGAVVSSTIRIAADGASCSSTIPVDVAREKVGRLYTKYIDGSSLLVTKSERKRVKVCDSSYQIRTLEGEILEKSVTEIADIVWHLRK